VTPTGGKTVKHASLGLGALALFAAAVAFSRSERPNELAIKQEKRNPWTSLRMNNYSDEFQFALVADRTGGHRPLVFSRAVERLNLLQPEFVITVGDLIEGGKRTDEQLEAEWQEFDGYVKRLQMPFFYVTGNHDVATAGTTAMWRKRFGRLHYHFVYRNVLFLCLNSDDPPKSGPTGNLGNEQLAWAKKTLGDNAGVRWTFVIVHKPMWKAPDLNKNGWSAIEKALEARPYTVFCGHVHRYQKFVRQGQNYYQVATTGGGSKMRGIGYGEFDHIVWVTMKKDGPVLANILLDSILPDDLKVPESTEEGISTKGRRPTYPVRGMVYLDGSPVAEALVQFFPVSKGKTRRGDALSEGDGSFVASTYTANDGLAEGKYIATVEKRRPMLTPEGKPGPNLLPAKYAKEGTSGLVVEIKKGGGEVRLELESGK
jgi:3',5'-cyclic AMP phosphodiesterase CpdA